MSESHSSYLVQYNVDYSDRYYFALVHHCASFYEACENIKLKYSKDGIHISNFSNLTIDNLDKFNKK